MSHECFLSRRAFMGGAAVALAAANQVFSAPAHAQAVEPRRAGAATASSLPPLKQIDAGVLSVGYAEAGPAHGPAVILLHGWPYDIHAFVDVVPILASAGFRVFVPYLRGYGTTRFLAASPSQAQDKLRERTLCPEVRLA